MRGACLPHVLILFALLLPVAGHASHLPDRTQLLLIPESQEIRMGQQAWDDLMHDQHAIVSRNRDEADPVLRVAERIIAAAKQSQYAERAQSFEWEIVTIKEDDNKNAWALPGGKIAIYTGIFPVAFTESGLAAIIGHEVAHALARHGAERVSQELVANVGLGVVTGTLGMSPVASQLAKLAVTGGILLPFSRSHESEADHIGLLLAAEAGYDPREAVRVWERMEEFSDGAPPEFLSTHPAHDTRIQNLTQWMPEAVAIYQQSQQAPDMLLPYITP